MVVMNDMDVPSEERTDWLTADNGDPGYREITEEEIISIAKKDDAVTNETEDDDDEEVTSPNVSHASACQALQTVLTYLEQQPAVPMGTQWTSARDSQKESNESKAD